MRRIAALPAILLLSACRTPVTRLSAPGEIPLRVNVRMHLSSPGGPEAEARLSEALRTRLADRARVLSRDSEALPEEAHLEVHILTTQERGDLVAENAKGAFLAPVKAVAGGNWSGDPRGYVFFVALGAIAGSVAAPVAAVGTEARGLYHEVRLGYQPRHLVCRITYRPSLGLESKELFSLGAWEVVKAMNPLPKDQARTAEAFQKEEAEALARVVCDRLTTEFHWVPLSRTPLLEPAP